MATIDPIAAHAPDLPVLELLIAAPRGFCAGVDRAIRIVELAIEKHGAPVYVRHEIVHNTRVVEDLKAKGAIFVEELDEVPNGAHTFFMAGGGGWSGERSKCHGRWPQDVMGTRSSRASPSASMARRKLAKERGKAFSKELGCGRASPRHYSDGACQKFRGEGRWTYPIRLDARQQSPPFRTRTPRRGPRSGRRQGSLAPCAAT